MDEVLNQKLSEEPNEMNTPKNPWENLIMVHMSPKELEQLDYMQGGKIIHPETEFRAYPGIAMLIENKDFKLFLNDLAEEILQTGHADAHVQKLTKDLPHVPHLKKFEPAPGDFTEEGIKLDAEGKAAIEEDDEIAHIPLEFANYLDHLRGGKIVNPIDGLRQYGKPWYKRLFSKPLTTIAEAPQNIVKEVIARPIHQVTGIPMTNINEGLRIAATVGGYMMGGPLGAGIGAATGNYATGADLQKSLMRGVGVGGAAWGGEAALGALGNGFGSQAAAPAFLNGTQVAEGAGAAGAGLGAGASEGAAATGGSSFLPSWLLPAASVGLIMHGHKQEKKDAERAREEHKREIEEYRRKHGLDTPLTPMVYHDKEYEPEEQPAPYTETHGMQRRHFRHIPRYAHGGKVHEDVHLLPGEEFLTTSKLIEGKGKGQDDKIPVNVPEDTYIVDASAVSRTGDGSSKAGAREWLDFAKHIEKKAHKLKHKIKLSDKRVPTMLSDGEVAIHPIVPAVLGNGSLSKGAKILKETIKDIRGHTSRNGDKLPPKVRSIIDHLPHEGRKILKAR